MQALGVVLARHFKPLGNVINNRSDHNRGFVTAGIAELREISASFFGRVRANKLRYFLVTLLMTIVVGVSLAKALREAYARGALQNSMLHGITSASLDLMALKPLHEDDLMLVETMLELNLDYHIQGIFGFGFPHPVPWYNKLYGAKRFDANETMLAALSRVAAYRNAHPSSSPLFQPGEPHHARLMVYLSPDSGKNGQ